MTTELFPLAALLLCGAVVAARLRRGNATLLNTETIEPREFPDPRILECLVREIPAESVKYILDAGSGYGDRARLVAKHFLSHSRQCLLVAAESNSTASSAAARETKMQQLHDHILHVRVDPELPFDPCNLIDGNLFDVVILSEHHTKLLPWAVRSLRFGGLLIASQGGFSLLSALEDEFGFTRLRICRGLGLGYLELVRAQHQCCVATQTPFPYDINPKINSLICGIRSSSLLPSRRRTPQLLLSAKPAVPRHRNATTGSRLRAAGVCFFLERDSDRVLLVSSSKRPHEWVLPAGGVELDDVSFAAAARRETAEESGYVCVGEREILVHEEEGKETHYFALTFAGTEAEVCETFRQRAWVHLEDATRLVSAPGSKLALLAMAQILRNV